MFFPEQPVLDCLHRYWTHICGTDSIPSASAFDPAAIRMILGLSFMLRPEPDGSFRYVHAGSRLCALFGRDLKGKTFLSHWGPGDLQPIGAMLEGTAANGLIGSVSFTGHTETAKSLDCDVALLPLRRPAHPRDLILGAFDVDVEPYWVGLTPIRKLEITRLRSTSPRYLGKGNRAANSNEATSGVCPRIRPRWPASRPARTQRGPHLVLLEGGATTS